MKPSMSSTRRTTSLALALVCAVLATSVARSQAPADSTAAPVPVVTTPAPTAVTSTTGKVTLRENMYYYDAFNRRDPFRSLVDGAFNRSDKMDLVNLSAVHLVGVVRGEVDRFALLEDSNGYSYILRVGDRVHNGTVVSIGEDELVARVTNFGQTTTVRLHLVGR
jgi:Tfp pilus assembly protein PilP